MTRQFCSYQCSVLAKRYNVDEPVLSIVCMVYDMSVYVDIIRKMINEGFCDYIVIEPYKLKDLFADSVF